MIENKLFDIKTDIIKFFEEYGFGYLLTESRKKLFLELLPKNNNDIGKTEKVLIDLINSKYVD